MNTLKTFWMSPNQLHHQLTKAPTGAKGSLLLCAAFLVMIVFFWYWLANNQQPAVGKITELTPVTSTQMMLTLHSPLGDDFVLTERTHPDKLLNQWVLVNGARINSDKSAPLIEQHLASMPAFSAILSSPTTWLKRIAEHEVVSIFVVALLLLFCGQLFRLLFLTTFIVAANITLWHSLYLAKWLGLMDWSTSGMVTVLVITTLALMPLLRLHASTMLPERILALVLWGVSYQTISTWYNLPDLAALGFFLLALCSPAVIAALVASYLLCHVIDATILGSYLTLAFCFIVMFARLTGVHPPAKAQFKRHYEQLKRQTLRLVKSKTPRFKPGKVTLAELLRKG